MSGILALVSQREFWSETQIRELVWAENERVIQTLYAESRPALGKAQFNELRAMRLFAAEKQQTWLLADTSMSYCILDDRRREKPRIQWRARIQDVLPIVADDQWSPENGVLQFGRRPKGWLYSKQLFPDRPVVEVVTRFLRERQAPV